jgi:mannosyltransferase OCH1-like enzyme
MIPRRIVQTWKTCEVPHKWQRYVQTLRHLHPDWDYKLYTDEDNETFMRTHYPQYYAAWKALPFTINRIDMIRYLYLHHRGGFYVDMDIELYHPLEELRSKGKIVTSSLFGWSGYLECAFIGSVPGHPFWLDLVNTIVRYSSDDAPWFHKQVLQMHKCPHVVSLTGPVMFGRVYRQYKNEYKRDFCILPTNSFYGWKASHWWQPQDKVYGKHHTESDWLFEGVASNWEWGLLFENVVLLVCFVVCLIWLKKRGVFNAGVSGANLDGFQC